MRRDGGWCKIEDSIWWWYNGADVELMRKYVNMNFKIKKMFVNGELDRDKAQGSNLRLALVRNGTLLWLWKMGWK